MNTKPTGNADLEFQALMARLTVMPGWTEKQLLELDMTRDLTLALLQTADAMCEDGASSGGLAVMAKYARVLNFMTTMLSGQRDISPPALRTLFEFAGLPVDEAYPE